jgi:hypothetical protein
LKVDVGMGRKEKVQPRDNFDDKAKLPPITARVD